MKRILVLYWHPDGLVEMRPAIHEHLHALDRGENDYDIRYENAFLPTPAWLRYAEFDAAVLHTTFLTQRWSETFASYKWRFRWLADLPVVKIALPQDEYDHSEILDEWLYELAVTDIFTCFFDHRELLYPTMSHVARIHPTLTGYIDEEMAARAASRMKPSVMRPCDIVYRATDLPFWFGRHGQEKRRIGEVVGARALARGMRVDISNRFDDTLYGDAWTDFLSAGQCVVGTESGSSVLDRRGEMQARIRSLLAGRPDLRFGEVSTLMPDGWDDYHFFAISPRHLEAIVTRTCQILVAGAYSGVLAQGRHYIALAQDYSNLEEVLDQVEDPAVVGALVERSYEEIYRSGRYATARFATELEELIDDSHAATRPLRQAVFPFVAAAGSFVHRVTAATSAVAMAAHRGASAPATTGRTGIRLAASEKVGAQLQSRGPTPRLRNLTVLAVAVGTEALHNAALRALFARYLGRCVWRTVPPRLLARDVLRLSVFHRSHAGTLSADGGRIRWLAGRNALPVSRNDPAGVTLGFDAEGAYDFEAFSALAARYPELARQALGSRQDRRSLGGTE